MCGTGGGGLQQEPAWWVRRSQTRPREPRHVSPSPRLRGDHGATGVRVRGGSPGALQSQTRTSKTEPSRAMRTKNLRIQGDPYVGWGKALHTRAGAARVTMEA